MRRLRTTLLMLLACLAAAAHGQEYSYDGNRWYEIEVVVFTHSLADSPVAERPGAGQLTLEYLPRLIELREATSGFMIDFEPASEEAFETTPEAMEEAAVVKGPEPPPRADPGFRITDFARDPYIALDPRFWKFTGHLARLRANPRHEVLWHGMWRQPMQGSAQTPSIAVFGGGEYGEHHELEGSMRFTDRDGQVAMDLNLWLSSFTASAGYTNGEYWSLPPRPLAEADPDDEPVLNLFRGRWQVAEVWQLRTESNVGTNTILYLDNPAFGVLVEARPYVLPVATLQNATEDF